jgi:hypothetical protein
MSKMNWQKVHDQKKMARPLSEETPRRIPKKQLATDKQLKYLFSLGYVGTPDISIRQASALISELINKK